MGAALKRSTDFLVKPNLIGICSRRRTTASPSLDLRERGTPRAAALPLSGIGGARLLIWAGGRPSMAEAVTREVNRRLNQG